MLAILWLIVWATVAEAFYDDYSWYTSDDGVSNARAFDSQRLARENFTNSLRRFAESYVRDPSREGDEELTMSKVKSRLRSLKVFKHTGKPRDFESSLHNFPESTGNIKKDEIMGTSYTDAAYIPKLRMLRRFAPPPAQCLKIHENYRIDWCNSCYCNIYYQRVCSDFKCPDHGGNLPPQETKKCMIGTRYQRGKCKYCYCNIGNVLICNTREYCDEPWWFLVRGLTNYEPQTSYVPTEPTEPTTTSTKITTIAKNNMKLRQKITKTEKINSTSKINQTAKIVKRTKTAKRSKKSRYAGKVSYKRAIGTNKCIEGSYYKIDSCNYCSCLNGKKLCTRIPCSDNNLGMKNAAESSVKSIGNDKGMEPDYIFDSGHEGALRMAPAVCSKKHEKYRIDWCNWCYCNDYHQRVCTDWPCPDHGGKPPPREKKKCIVGARYQRGKCKYCYCNVGSVMICNTRVNCNEPWWYLVNGTTPFEPQTAYVPPPKTTKMPSTTKKSNKTTSHKHKIHTKYIDTTKKKHPAKKRNTTKKISTKSTPKIGRIHLYLRNGERECIEGSKYQKDYCNYCSCVNGKELCTSKSCPDNDFDTSSEDIENDEIIGPSDTDTEVISDQKDGQQFQLASVKCLPDHELYRIDWCNWCYCNDYYQRVCTDFPCDDHDGRPHPSERKKCIVGARYERGKCKYCYCNIRNVMICKTIKDCDETWWFLEYGTTKWRPQTLPPNNEQAATNWQFSLPGTTIESRELTTKQPTTTKMPNITENSRFYRTPCPDNDSDPDNNMIKLAEEMVNAAEPSFEKIDNDEDMGPSQIDTELTFGKKKGPLTIRSGQINFKIPPTKCIKKVEYYKVDWCNWCYCNEYHQRVCTDWECSNGDKPLPPQDRKCLVGTKYERGKCKYCYCNRHRILICYKRTDCNEPWWFLVHGLTKYRPQTPYVQTPRLPTIRDVLKLSNSRANTTTTLSDMTTTLSNTTTTLSNTTTTLSNTTTILSNKTKLTSTTSSSDTIVQDFIIPKIYFHVRRHGERQCIDGSYYNVDSCNYCLCFKGKKMCSIKVCPIKDLDSNAYYNMVGLPKDVGHTAKSPFENIESNVILRPSNDDTQFVPNEKGIRRFRLPPQVCLQKQERYRIDWCNWCYCDEYFQRICTDFKCPDHGGKPHPPERKKCLRGARYKRGKCKFCYCNDSRSIICTTRKNCNDPWWNHAHGSNDTETVLPLSKRVLSSDTPTAELYYHLLLNAKTNHHLRNEGGHCIEGSYYKVDSCNYCICFNKNVICSSKRCPANELDILNDPKSSFPVISKRTESDEIVELRYVDTEFTDEKDKQRRFRPAPKKCNIKQEIYRIDWCNWCFCNAQYQRVCTDWNCYHQAGERPPRDSKQCIVGTRFERGKCKYCYCGVGNSLICRTKEICLARQRRSSNSFTLNYNCDEGILLQIDDCNYCLCTHRRKWKCTKTDCPSKYHQGALRMTYHHNDASPKKCNIGEKLRLDACNYCYCNENRVRICTDNKCHHQEETDSRFPLDSAEEEDCKLGTRFRQGECNYCYCNNNHKLVCSVNQCLRRSIDSRLPHNKITIINL